MQRAVRVLADDLSAIIGARDEPEVARFHDRVLSRARHAEATVFRGGRPRTDRLSAAVANAVAADWLELDEGYRHTPCHAGLYVLPALLAEPETRNLAFGELIRALVLGYEIVTRVARGWTPKAMNMQSHGRYSAIGAAAAVAVSHYSSQALVDCNARIRSDAMGRITVDPLHGFGREVVLADVSDEFAFEIGHGTEDAARDHIALDLSEPEFHLVEPRRTSAWRPGAAAPRSAPPRAAARPA